MSLVSVIMPVYNAEKFLPATIESILSQTYRNFEFLITDDGSKDNSWDIIKSYSNDDRIKIFKNETNIGYVKTLNNLLEIACGKYIARQDNDDIALPRRLEYQVNFLESHSSYGLCGSRAIYFGSRKGKMPIFYEHEELKARMMFGNFIVHPSVLIRSHILKDNKLAYDPNLCPSEDYALWFEISKMSKICNLNKTLIRYRVHETNVSQLKYEEQINRSNEIRHSIIEFSFSLKLTEQEKSIHNFISRPQYLKLEDLNLLERWLMKLYDLNSKNNIFDQEALRSAILDSWSLICRNNQILAFSIIIKRYYSFELFKIRDIFKLSSIKTVIKNLLK